MRITNDQLLRSIEDNNNIVKDVSRKVDLILVERLPKLERDLAVFKARVITGVGIGSFVISCVVALVSKLW